MIEKDHTFITDVILNVGGEALTVRWFHLGEKSREYLILGNKTIDMNKFPEAIYHSNCGDISFSDLKKIAAAKLVPYC
jgi:hypothetical protein